MRKNLQQIPVYAADATPSDPPIDWITPQDADERVRAGSAISLKGRAIRMRKERPGTCLSRSPGHELIHRYAEAKNSGQDQAVINACESWAGKVVDAETLRNGAEGMKA
jgi:hypothetical protein